MAGPCGGPAGGKTTERVDVAIVGAGPAGSSTAIELGERAPEQSVLLIEGIRRKSTLSPGAPGGGHSMCSGVLGRAQLANLGWPLPPEVKMAELYRVFIQTRSVTAEFEAEQLAVQGPLAVVTNRKRFDDWLLSMAIASGAHYEQGTRVTSTARAEGGWRITAQDGREFLARTLVGADGPESRIAATHLNAPPVPGDDMYLATEVYVRSSAFPKDAMLGRLQTSRLEGYYWAFSAGDVVKVGCGSSRAGGRQVSGETTWWRQQLADQYGDAGFTGPVVERVGGRITCARPLETVVDPAGRVAAVGEAARAVLASAGAGDATSVESGRALGRAIASDDLGAYQQWWTHSMRRVLRRHYRIKRMMLSMSDDELDRLARSASSFRPRSTNARKEVPRFFLYLMRKRGLMIGRVAVRAALR